MNWSVLPEILFGRLGNLTNYRLLTFDLILHYNGVMLI